MKYNRFTALIAGMLILLTGISSCDYLEIVPMEQPKLEDAFQDPEKTLGYLYSCYNGLNSWKPVEYYNEDCSSTDEYVLPVELGASSLRIATNQISSATGGDWTWRYCGYDPIRSSHLFLEGVKTAPRVTDTQKRQWSAEAKFLIAYYHFMVLRKYGPCPIMDHAYDSNTPTSEMPGRSHYDYVTDYIVRMLDECMPDLLDRQTGSDWGRADKMVAKAIKARVLLYAASPLWNGNDLFETKWGWKNTNYETPGYGYELVSKTYDSNKWVKAEAACQEALDFALRQGMELYNKSDFDELKKMAEGDTKEFMKYVLRMRYTTLARANTSEGSTEMIWATPEQGNAMMGGLPHRMFKKSNGDWVSGYSVMAPTLYAVENFYTKSGKLPAEDPNFAPQSEWFTTSEGAGVPSISGKIIGEEVIKLHANREPRFYAWIGFSGGEFGTQLLAGSPLILEMRDGEKHGYSKANFNRDNSTTGYLVQKFIHPRLEYNIETGSSNSGQLNAPRPLIRMSELYLNLAECQAALGETSQFLLNINPVRRRAGIPALTEGDLTNTKTATDWVRNERFIEFFGESIRFYDVRRWKEGPKYFAGPYHGLNVAQSTQPTFGAFNAQTPIIGYKVAWEDRLYLMPLYFIEIGKNPQMLQSPGY